jgi:hypothetical protein
MIFNLAVQKLTNGQLARQVSFIRHHHRSLNICFLDRSHVHGITKTSQITDMLDLLTDGAVKETTRWVCLHAVSESMQLLLLCPDELQVQALLIIRICSPQDPVESSASVQSVASALSLASGMSVASQISVQSEMTASVASASEASVASGNSVVSMISVQSAITASAASVLSGQSVISMSKLYFE